MHVLDASPELCPANYTAGRPRTAAYHRGQEALKRESGRHYYARAWRRIEPCLPPNLLAMSPGSSVRVSMERTWTWPIVLTISRILLIAPVLWSWSEGHYLLSIALAAIMFLTDFLDGKLARALNQQSATGAILDPVADKLVVLSMFGYLLYLERVPFWYVALIYVRDIAQLLSIPILMWWMKIQFKVKPSLIAKWGTALNFILLFWIFGHILVTEQLPDPYSQTWEPIIRWSLLAVSSLIEIYVLVTYIPRFFQIMTGRHDTFE